MTDVRVRNVDDWVVESIRQQARAQGKSLEATVRELLRQEAMRPKQELAARLKKFQDEIRDKYGMLSDSTALIREARDQRGQ
jgi:plasmid stability protein